ncbi:MAG: mannose-6-phosphate isomerase-like protein (cupin superfamily) [Gammaproteobacteria bacterium]|jgi:mannose-6-phosphate isomerase-like protein (cupin superfamily)
MPESKKAKWTVAEAQALLPANVSHGRRYAEPLSNGTMRLGYYAPRGHDPQKPHDQDELCFVYCGTGIFVCGDERLQFDVGDVLFVAAGNNHRFEDFTDDFAAWVVFWGPPGGE